MAGEEAAKRIQQGEMKGLDFSLTKKTASLAKVRGIKSYFYMAFSHYFLMILFFSTLLLVETAKKTDEDIGLDFFCSFDLLLSGALRLHPAFFVD